MMNASLFHLQFYLLGIFLFLLVVIFYYQVSRYEWSEAERRRLEQAELNLSVILRLLDAPDVRYLMSRPRSRRYLFSEYSRSLKSDVFSLLRTRELGMTSVALVGVFLLAYGLLKIKSLLLCQPNDLRFLSGLELALFRSLPE